MISNNKSTIILKSCTNIELDKKRFNISVKFELKKKKELRTIIHYDLLKN